MACKEQARETDHCELSDAWNGRGRICEAGERKVE
jgi:hypothetical protein